MLSMTGFGQNEVAAANGAVFVAEISSVNRKQLEMRIALPPELSGFEPEVRRIVGARVSRGAVGVRIGFADKSAAASVTVNRPLLELLAAEALALRKKFNLTPEFNAAELLALPGVLNHANLPADDLMELAVTAAAALEGALDKFIEMRRREGAAIGAELADRLKTLKAKHAEIGGHTAQINRQLKQKMLARLAEENLPVAPDDERLLRELLFYADRADVSEELSRLSSHFDQFSRFLGEPVEPVGRSLDFLLQEMFREITTLGNKAAGVEISPLVVAFKSELEKIREQVQNIE